MSAAENLNYDGEVEGWSKDWYFPNALLFTITIMTTIGYGHICPQTDSGKLFTIIYAMVSRAAKPSLIPQIGMPLFVMFLGGIGDTMANGFKYTYSRICCRLVPDNQPYTHQVVSDRPAGLREGAGPVPQEGQETEG